MRKIHDRTILGNLEAAVTVFGKISEMVHLQFHDVEDGVVTGWNADVMPTSREGLIYLAQYPQGGQHSVDSSSRQFSESLLLRIKQGDVQSLYSIQKLPHTALLQEVIVGGLRRVFKQHEGEHEIKEADLSIGRKKFRVYGPEMGDGFERVLFWTGSLISMNIFGTGTEVRDKGFYPGCPLASGCAKIYEVSGLPPGFR